MRGQGLKVASCAVVAGGLALASPARAEQQDTQLWLYFDTVVPMARDANATFELSPRFREGGDQFLARGTVEFKLAPGVSLGGGAAYGKNHGAADEFRPHQQLTLTAGRFAFRTRVEERFFSGADRMQLRLRQRVQLAQPVARDTRLSLAGEVFYIARTENRAGDARVESWRGSAALQHRFSQHVEGTLGYLLLYAPRAGKPDKLSHVPQLTLTARL